METTIMGLGRIEKKMETTIWGLRRGHNSFWVADLSPLW